MKRQIKTFFIFFFNISMLQINIYKQSDKMIYKIIF